MNITYGYTVTHNNNNNNIAFRGFRNKSFFFFFFFFLFLFFKPYALQTNRADEIPLTYCCGFVRKFLCRITAAGQKTSVARRNEFQTNIKLKKLITKLVDVSALRVPTATTTVILKCSKVTTIKYV